MAEEQPGKDGFRISTEKNVILSIRGIQALEEQEEETIELVTEGRLLTDGDGSYTLSYQESEVTGLEGTLTTFQIEEGRVILLRMGAFNSQMVFEQGRQHLSVYNTPYGALSVGVLTKRLDCTIGPAGGNIEIDYTIEMNHTMTGRNLFQIHVRENQRATDTGDSRTEEKVI
ncbi:MAG: DUF1934 domain-containing protein [Oscillospiraceae bacterium]|nr:DUF1934 domain-containing protein [Oscillospiraceae bacterium]